MQSESDTFAVADHPSAATAAREPAPAATDNGLMAQIRRNMVALISLTIAITSLLYGTWRNEQSEFNQNMREAAFETLLQLGELQMVVFELHYGRSHGESEAARLAREGWAHALLINDLSLVMPVSTTAAASELRDTWQASWEHLGDGSDRRVEPLNKAIDAHRLTVLDTLKALR